MTPIEFILLFAVVVMIGQVFILQMHYGEKLASQAAVLNYLVNMVAEKENDREVINSLREKIFHSSH